MTVRANRFNDPALGQAFGNLASIFAPPSAQDILAYTSASAKREEAERLAWLFNNASDPLADRKATMAGVYAPTQSFYAVDQNTATTRRGQDISAATDLERQRIAGQFGLANQFMTPLNPGQVQPGLPDGVAGAFGVPVMPRTQGLPKPLTVDELNAQTLQGMPQQMREAVAFGSTPLEEVLQGEQTVFATRPGAVGQTVPPAAAGSQPARDPVILRGPNGETTRGFLDKSTGIVRTEDGQPAPPGFIPFDIPRTQGTPEETGLGRTNKNRVDGQGLAAISALDTLGQLESLIASSPASQGLVGSLRGTAQNIMQTGNELGRYFGGTIAEVTNAVNSGMLDAGVASEMFDPNIPAINMLMNVLAWQYAKTMAGDRVSNEQLRIAREAVGDAGLFNNQANSLVRLGQLRQMFTRDLTRLSPVLSDDVRTMASPFMGVQSPQPGAVPMPAAPTAPSAGAVPQGIDPQLWQFMTPEERALFQ